MWGAQTNGDTQPDEDLISGSVDFEPSTSAIELSIAHSLYMLKNWTAQFTQAILLIKLQAKRSLVWILIWFELIVLFYMDSLNKTRSLFYIKVHEAKKALIKDIGPVNRVHLTVLVSVASIYILGIGSWELIYR